MEDSRAKDLRDSNGLRKNQTSSLVGACNTGYFVEINLLKEKSDEKYILVSTGLQSSQRRSRRPPGSLGAQLGTEPWCEVGAMRKADGSQSITTAS